MPFEYAVANGFDAFEWFPDKKESGLGWDEGDLDMEARSYIKDSASEHGISLSVHASLHCNLTGEQSTKILFSNIEFAQHIGASLLNIHLVNDDGIEKYIESIKPVISYTARAGLKLAVENTPLTGPEEFNAFFTLLKKQHGLPISHIGMCLDTGHANLHDATRNDYLKFLDMLNPHVPIIHMHIHENYGDSDSHLPIFTGPSSKDTSSVQVLIERLKQRGFSGSVILEQWPRPALLLNEARDRLYHMFHVKSDVV